MEPTKPEQTAMNDPRTGSDFDTGLTRASSRDVRVAKTVEWLEAHRDYPHEDCCLVWPFSRDSRLGRGSMKVKGWGGWAHRNMCTLAHGPAPADKPIAVHSCGNGHLGCVNPRHLSWSTYSDNQFHRYACGRGNPNSHGNKSMFTEEQIAEIRTKYGEFTTVELAAMYGCSIGTIQYYLKYRERLGHEPTHSLKYQKGARQWSTRRNKPPATAATSTPPPRPALP